MSVGSPGGAVIYLDVEHLSGNVTVDNVILTDTRFHTHRIGSYIHKKRWTPLISVHLLACYVGADGFEPPKSKDSRFTVCPIWPLWKTPSKITINAVRIPSTLTRQTSDFS